MLTQGHKVTAVAPDFSSETMTTLQQMGVACREVSMDRRGLSPKADIKLLSALRRLLKSERPDLLVTFTIKPNIWGAIAAYSAGVKSAAMVTGLGYALTHEGGSAKARLVIALSRRLYRFATRLNDFVFFQNTDDRDDFIQMGCLADPSKVRLVGGSGVDMKHYDRTPLPAEPVFLMISRLLGDKGVREYAAAAAIVKRDMPEARFLLVGGYDEGLDGISSDEVAAWQADGLEYMGQIDDVRPYLSQCSTYVLPSYREGTPRSVLEAMSMGRPIITTDVPGCRQTTIDGETGTLVPLKDVNSLAAAMEDLAQNPEVRANYGDAAHERIRQIYDVDIVNESLMRQLELI